MRSILAVALVAGLALVGCEKKQGPQTTDPNVTMTPPTGGGLEALEPPTSPSPPPTGPVALTPPLPTPAPTPAPAPLPVISSTAPPEGDRAEVYVIQKGDTFIKLARRFYGSDAKFRDIQAANPGVDPTKLQVGQQIVLPPK